MKTREEVDSLRITASYRNNNLLADDWLYWQGWTIALQGMAMGTLQETGLNEDQYESYSMGWKDAKGEMELDGTAA